MKGKSSKNIAVEQANKKLAIAQTEIKEIPLGISYEYQVLSLVLLPSTYKRLYANIDAIINNYGEGYIGKTNNPRTILWRNRQPC